MKIENLLIQNFKSIKNAELSDLAEMVIIAGPNGCGKSTIFDGIRLLKSVYGGYQQNEWQQWFNEFQLSLNDRRVDLLSLAHNRNYPIIIEAKIVLEVSEKKYISDNLASLVNNHLWEVMVPNTNLGYMPGPSIASQIEQYEPNIQKRQKKMIPVVEKEISQGSLIASLRISKDLDKIIQVDPSPLLSIIFSQFDPQNIGIIDYHGPQRNYQREQISGVNLNIETMEQNTKQHALYNYANKYTNIKNEMVSSYVRELIAKESGVIGEDKNHLLQSLEELFNTFFPGKHFHGPIPTEHGGLLFPVKKDDGTEHDINELSSGEKEVLYGYLRLYSMSPKQSVLLIDEPELHLNPRLVQGLPQFYRKHLGKKSNNQIWLLTHSDAMLREGLLTENACVLHMLPSDFSEKNDNQIRKLSANEEIELAIIDLVGDLATYKPGSKVVIFEGGGNSEFDITLVNKLFPEYSNSLNLVSGGNKSGVKNLFSLLEKTRQKGLIPIKVFSIVDKDLDPDKSESDYEFNWDVYHVENYLIKEKYILGVLKDLLAEKCKLKNEEDITRELKICAEETIPSLVSHLLLTKYNSQLMELINLEINPRSQNMSKDLNRSIHQTIIELTKKMNTDFDISTISIIEQQFTKKFKNDLSSDAWKKTYRGRDILKLLAGKFCKVTKYDYFRNLVIAKMRDDSYKPQGMKDLLEKIIHS